jgi:hypothetical protein
LLEVVEVAQTKVTLAQVVEVVLVDFYNQVFLV